MPRQQVYGKRSRAIYDPFDAFASPQRGVPKDLQEVKISPVEEVLSRSSHRNGIQMQSQNIWRRALGELSSNAVMLPDLPARSKVKKPGRARNKIVAGERASDSGEQDTARRDNNSSTAASPGDTLHGRQEEAPTTDVDDVPLFCHDHGYDTEDEDLERKIRSLSLDGNSEEQHSSQDAALGTPTISIRPATPPVPDEFHEHCAKLLELSTHSMTMFSEWSNELSSHFNINKIAEASFGEVYRLSLLEQIPGFSSQDESVFKIVALRPPDSTLPTQKIKLDAALKKVEGMSAVEDVAIEVKLLQRMSSIPGFTNFREIRVLKGRPPQPFVKAFKDFNTTQKARKKELSHFRDPSKKASYSDDQLWAVIEMQDAGMDLEQLVEGSQTSSMFYIWDVFWQVVLSLAKGEEGVKFEHRDLHLGNICVRQSAEKDASITTKRKLNFSGLETTIIDYTISRAVMQNGTVAYHDLSRDNGIFDGDSTEEYQYDIYRYMRGALLADDPYVDEAKMIERAEQDDKSWQQYHPVSNLIWLHFILYKLLEQVEWPSASKAPPRKQKAQHAEWKRANDLEHVLLRVQELLDPGTICQSDLRSTSDLVGLALTESWLDEEDVVGVEESQSGLVERIQALKISEQQPPKITPEDSTTKADFGVRSPRRTRRR